MHNLQTTSPNPLFTFLGDEVVFGSLPLRDLKGWDWSARLANAGIQRLEFLVDVTREEFEGFLDDVLARLTLRAIDTSEARQLRPSAIRFGAVGVRGEETVEELPIDETWVGHRPGSRDDAPILGPGPLDGLFYATGHHRNGILLAPVTADAMARLILDDVVEQAIKPFGLERFLPARAAE